MGARAPYKRAVPRKYLFFAALVLVVVALDQWTKYLALGELTNAFDRTGSFGERLAVMFSAAPPEPVEGYGHFARKRAVVISESFFQFRYDENPAAAFGLGRSLPDGVRGPLFHLVSIGAVILITVSFSRLSGKDKAERWAYVGLPLVLGGAIGNWIDRIARGFVIDFIGAHWYDKAAWPSFNIADSAICVGVGMLMIDAWVRKEKKTA